MGGRREFVVFFFEGEVEGDEGRGDEGDAEFEGGVDGGMGAGSVDGFYEAFFFFLLGFFMVGVFWVFVFGFLASQA